LTEKFPAAGKRVVLARIGAPHGVRGEMRVKAFTADPKAIGGYGPLWLDDGRSFAVEALRPVPASPDMLVVRLSGVGDRNEAAALTNRELFVDRDRLPPAEEDEFYHADLIGLAAVSAEGKVIGRVFAVVNYGAGDILEIKPPHGDTILVPFTKAAVPAVDLATGRVTVAELPETGEREPSGE
jgi:16S rRNA processing protein RimM